MTKISRISFPTFIMNLYLNGIVPRDLSMFWNILLQFVTCMHIIWMDGQIGYSSSNRTSWPLQITYFLIM